MTGTSKTNKPSKKVYFDAFFVASKGDQEYLLGSYQIDRSELSEVTSAAIVDYILNHKRTYFNEELLNKYQKYTIMPELIIRGFFRMSTGIKLELEDKGSKLIYYYIISNIHEF